MLLKVGRLCGTAILYIRTDFRKGKAITKSATAKKLREIIWNLLTTGASYDLPTAYRFFN